MRSTVLLGLACVTLGSLAGGCWPRPCAMEDTSPPPTPTNGSGGPTATPRADATATVLEADVVQLDHEQNRVYAMSRSGTLSVVDASQPGALTLLGQTTLSGIPFEMHRQGNILLAMSTASVASDGTPTHASAAEPAPSATTSSMLVAVDVSSPQTSHIVAWVPVAGEIIDSRIVGHFLYLATYEDVGCFGCGASPTTAVTSYDISDPTSPYRVDRAELAGPSADSRAWVVTPWKRSIFANDQRIYIGGMSASPTTDTNQGVIQVIDISDPTGRLRNTASLAVPGAITSRWQMDETDGILRVVSERGAGWTANGEAAPEVDTFRVATSDAIAHLGHTTLTLPAQEALKSVRFDGPRAYVVTAQHTDPLFTIDLSDPALPVQRGSIEIPGWVFHLETKGNQLLGLGLDPTNPQGSLTLSLFDVTSLDQPRLVSRQAFGPPAMFSELQLTTEVLAEDQDRMDKAFRVFDDGLIAVPYSAANGNTSLCAGGGVQLFQYSATTLQKEALLPMSGNARRAIRRDSDTSQELIGVSDSNVSSFDITQRAAGTPTADVVIGTCTPRVLTPQAAQPAGGDVTYPGDYVDYSSKCE